jgi:hypothetical protein
MEKSPMISEQLSWRDALAAKRDICVSEQGPGFYTTKFVRHGPIVLVRIMWDHGVWIILVNGEVAKGSGTDDPWDCPFYRRGPFAPISAQQYDNLMWQYEAAPPGHPLRTPGDKVDWRAASATAIYRGKTRI